MLIHTVAFDRRGLPHPVADDDDTIARAVRRAHRRPSFLWIEAWDPDTEEMERLARLLGLHRRSAAEAATGRQQPKIRSFDRHLTIVMWTIEFRTSHPRVAVGEVFLFVMRNALLTVRRPRLPDTQRTSSRLADPDMVVHGGALGAAFTVMGDQCDDYIALTDGIEQELEEIEQQVYDDTVVENRTRIYNLRQRIGKVGRAVGSLATALEASRDNLRNVSVAGEEVGPYVRDLLDRLGSTATLLRDQSTTLDAVISSHENNAASRQNDDTRRISAIAALLSVPALTAGIFGMNFGDLPLTKSPLGWVWALAIAVVVDAVIVVLFRRRGWL